MAALVRKLPDPAGQKQAIRLVALHYLHKKHLARLLPLAVAKAENDDDERDFRILSKLWNCPPHGVLLGDYRGDGPGPRVCGLAWVCPWCHARKVVALYERLRQGPLKAPKAKYLLYGKAAPFGEPMGGIDGVYTADDYHEYYHGPKVRGHWGRCYGRHPQRVRSTRQARVAALLEEARPFLPGGLWKGHLGDGARAKRESTSDSQFARAQAARHAQAKQQCGNRQRQRQARERLQQLLEAAPPLWDQVQAEPHHGRGRPPHRARLEELLERQGIRLDRGDRDWLMKALRQARR